MYSVPETHGTEINSGWIIDSAHCAQMKNVTNGIFFLQIKATSRPWNIKILWGIFVWKSEVKV